MPVLFFFLPRQEIYAGSTFWVSYFPYFTGTILSKPGHVARHLAIVILLFSLDDRDVMIKIIQ